MPAATSLDLRTILPDFMAIPAWIPLAIAAGCASLVSEGHLHGVFALFIIFITGRFLVRLPFPARSEFSRGSCMTAPVGRLFGDSTSRVGRVLSIALIAALLVAIGVTISIIVMPGEGEPFTEFYILGPKGKAADYPAEFMAGTPQAVIIGIRNHECREVTYTVETLAIESRLDNATGQSVISSATLLDRYSVTVAHNQTVEQPYTFRVGDPDVNQIEFLLFKDEAPPEDLAGSDLIAASYRDLHLWLRVH